MNSDIGTYIASILYLIFIFGIIIGLIVLIVVLAKKSGNRAKESEKNIARMISQIPQDKQRRRS